MLYPLSYEGGLRQSIRRAPAATAGQALGSGT